ncbi:MAG: sugar ABC transporter substrate-binding protein [Armatimonadetes bacterium]|nr:sugar ABC transporter substrate-binding protein [Armatimonadota bacterium]
MGRKHIFLIIFLCLIAMVAGDARESTGRAQRKTGRPVVLRITGWISSFVEQEILLQSLGAFEKSHPEIRVSYEPYLGYGDSYYVSELITAIKEGRGPDVFYVGAERVKSMNDQDLLLPLGSRFKEKEAFLPELVSLFSNDGETYGIPKDFNTFVLFYRSDLFKENGIPVPDQGWTWKELKEAARVLTDPAKGRAGLCIAAHDPSRWLLFPLQSGAQLFSKDGSRCLLNSREAIDGFNFALGMRNEDRSTKTPEELGCRSSGEALGKGKAAMIIEGGWVEPYFRKAYPKEAIGAGLLPRGPKGRQNFLFTVAYAVSKKTAHPAEAWKLVDYLTSPENQKRVAETGMALPTRKALLESLNISRRTAGAVYLSRTEAVTYAFGKAGEKGVLVIGKAVKEIFQGGKPLDATLEQAVEELNSWLLNLPD